MRHLNKLSLTGYQPANREQNSKRKLTSLKKSKTTNERLLKPTMNHLRRRLKNGQKLKLLLSLLSNKNLLYVSIRWVKIESLRMTKEGLYLRPFRRSNWLGKRLNTKILPQIVIGESLTNKEMYKLKLIRIKHFLKIWIIKLKLPLMQRIKMSLSMTLTKI